MRFESLRILAFGPFTDTPPLDFAPGMTIIYGRNETGKSSWHAALYAALCGTLRARGRMKEDSDFRDFHRPWDGQAWAVSAVVTLEDGRHIELQQDLDGKLACTATDTLVGRDVSPEIINDGSPDGSRWLGLDRRAFLATACVSQAQVLDVAQDPSALQEHVERAAATAGADETAAGALEIIKEFRAERVGLDRAHASKPLRLAIEAVDAAGQELAAAVRDHDTFVDLGAGVEALIGQADAAGRELHAFAGAMALSQADAIQAEASRAEELSERYQTRPAPDLRRDDELAQEVRGALDSWQTLPAAPDLSGPSAADIRQMLTRAPAPARGAIVMWAAAATLLVLGAAAAATSHLVPGAELVFAGVVTAWIARATAEPAGGAAVRFSQEGHLRAREQLEESARKAEVQRHDAERRLEVLSDRCGVDGADVMEKATKLRQWLGQRAAEVGAVETELQERAELHTLLAGGSLEDLRQRAAELLRQARELEEAADPKLLEAVELGADPQAELWRRRQVAQAARSEADKAKGELRERARILPSVAAAEERLAIANAELERVNRLATILELTSEFLHKAEERLHRDIAPRLQEALRRWLPRVTGGRYEDATVDPLKLEVMVRADGARWRQAALLSQATREQVYLLLRMALAQHLTKKGEVCPLILDDVTVQSDETRTERLLELLHEFSRERQIILFSQEQGVRAWAERNLGEPQDRLHLLDVTAVPA